MTDIASDIRIIARTKEIEEKADKALQVAEAVKKETIDVKRITTNQTGQTTTGSNGQGETAGTDAGGTYVTPPLAPPIQPAQQATFDAALNAAAQAANSAASNATQAAGGTGNLSGNASGSLNDTSGDRTKAAQQADPSNKDADWAAIEARLAELGYSQDSIDDARRLYFSNMEGQHEIGDVMTGDAIKLTLGSFSSPINGGGLEYITSGIKDVLNAVVGVDPNDPSMGIMLRFDGRTPEPSARESAANDQNPWPDPTTPPPKAGWEYWELGWYWHASGIPAPTVPNSPTPAGSVDAYMSYLTSLGSDTYHYENLVIDMGAHTATYDIFYIDHISGNTIPSGSGTAVGIGCDVGHASVCPTQAEVESYWPPVGLYLMSLNNGNWVYNIYDPSLPSQYYGQTGAVKIASTTTGSTYEVEPAIEGGFMISDLTNSNNPSLFFGADRSLRAVFPSDYVNFYRPQTAINQTMPTE